jgi:hypothetical protein
VRWPTILTGQIVANLVILSRASERNKSALLIEGNKDGRLYRKVTDPNSCRLFAAGNRHNAEDALGILKAAAQKGVLAIVDADTDHLTGTKSADPDLLITHTRDAEGILLSSESLRAILVEFDLDHYFGPSPELAAIAAAAPIGYLRFVAEQKKWSVRTAELDFAQFVDASTLKCDVHRLCTHMAALTTTIGITAADYESALSSLMAKGVDPYKVARGHDATSLLAWAMLTQGGKKRKDGAMITSTVVESFLRTAYSPAAFAKCELFRQIDQWEARNVPYKILKRT